MPKSQFVNFKAVKSLITMERVLEHYGILDKFTRKGESLSGPCPIHKGSNPTQFRVSLSKNLWNCFSECKHGGNALDFIARMENVSIHAAATKAIEWFGLDEEAVRAKDDGGEEGAEETEHEAPAPKRSEKKPAQVEDGSGPNKPLKFRLDKLERNHPYLTERGLSEETLNDFGAGFCGKGIMAGRIAIPIANPAGFIVAYAGRLAGEATDDAPKYKLPPGFRKSLELFNIDRAIKEPAESPLVIVEGFFDCMKLHQAGCKKVVALMGSTMSSAQEELLKKHLPPAGKVIVMLDEDEAGQAGRDDIAQRLSKFCFVKVHVFDKAEMQPENLTAGEIQKIVNP